MPLSIVDIMNFTNYFSVLSHKKPPENHFQEACFYLTCGAILSPNSWIDFI